MADAKTLNTNNFSDTNLYRDATGKGAKIAEPVASAGTASSNRGSIAPKPSDASPEIESLPQELPSARTVKEHLDTLFDGEELSEDFMKKTETIFESAVNERVQVATQQLEEAVAESYEVELDSFKGELVERIDDYLNYVVEEWMNENEVAIEKGIRSEIAESFIEGLKKLFETNYIDIPEERVDVLEELVAEHTELTNSFNDAINENMELNKDIELYKRAELFSSVSDGLSDVQIDRFASLAEGIEFKSADEYQDKLQILKTSYFGGDNSTPSENYEEELTSNTQTTLTEGNSPMNMYVNTLNRQKDQRKLYEDKN